MIKKCLRPGCGRTAVSRGLCDHCYSTIKYLIRSGKVTMKQLEKAGKVKVPDNINGRGRKSEWFMKGIK